jgi:hypothetical protein
VTPAPGVETRRPKNSVGDVSTVQLTPEGAILLEPDFRVSPFKVIVVAAEELVAISNLTVVLV